MSFTPDPGCSSGRRDPGPGRRSLPLHGLQDLHLKPLRSSPRDGTRRCVLGDSIVRHVRATLAEGKVHSLLFPWCSVLDVSAQIPAILKDDESIAAVVIQRGLTTLSCGRRRHWRRTSGAWSRQYSTSPETTIIMSGPLPTYRRGHKRFSRLFALNEWLWSWCKDQKRLFVIIGIFSGSVLGFSVLMACPSRVGAELLSDNITRTLRSIWLVSQFSNNSYDDFCSTHLNDRGTCSVHTILCLFPE